MTIGGGRRCSRSCPARRRRGVGRRPGVLRERDRLSDGRDSHGSTGTGAPAHSFDTIYEFFGAQLNVATAAPGDAGYNGGRWMVHGLDWNTSYEDAVAEHGGSNGVIDTNAEIAAVLADGGAGGATTFEVKRFVCPVIKLPG